MYTTFVPWRSSAKPFSCPAIDATSLHTTTESMHMFFELTSVCVPSETLHQYCTVPLGTEPEMLSSQIRCLSHYIRTHTWQYWSKHILRSRWLRITSRPAFFFREMWFIDCLCISTTMIACGKNFHKLQSLKCPMINPKNSCTKRRYVQGASTIWIKPAATCQWRPVLHETASLGHPSTSDEDWYWPKCVLILQSATLQNI